MVECKTILNESLEAQALTLAKDIAEKLLRDIEARGTGLMILPGGSSPKKLITALAQENLPWDKIQITTTDERCVPLGSEYSNAGQITSLFLEQGVVIKPIALWDDGTQSMADILQLAWPATITVLGMGEDGHVASLFPEQDWDARGALTLKATAPSEPKNRISLSMEALCNAGEISLLVSNDKKYKLCQEITAGQQESLPLAQFIEHASGKLTLHAIGLSN